MEIDLDNNGGGGNNDAAAAVVSRSPDPADPRMKELPPFTWLRVAPYVIAVLAGVALLSVGVARMVSRPCPAAGADGENKPAASNTIGGCDALGSVLAVVGMVLVMLPAYLASFELNCDCCVPRLDQADG